MTASFALCCVILCVLNGFYNSLVTVNKNGGYEGIVVAVSPDTDPSETESLLQKLQDAFRNASSFLFTATRNQFYFAEIIFVLPRTFSLQSHDWDLTPKRKYLSAPDVIILEDSIFKESLYTVQHAGCAEHGLRMYMPTNFLKDSNNFKSKVLVREWIHYRYGVFEEYGYPGDQRYPELYSIPGDKKSNLHVAQCTNEDVTYSFRDSSGGECKSVNDCHPFPKEPENSHIKSSLMYSLSFPQMNQFCDDEMFRHNRNSPTKQNALCREKSVWEVIKQHQDFHERNIGRKNKEKRKNTPVKFKFVVESDPQIILLVDSTENMAINNRMDFIKNAFFYFIMYDLPQNSKIGIINLQTVQADPVFVTLKDTVSNEKLFDYLWSIFPEAYGNEEICISCGLFKAMEALNENKNLPSSGTIILVTTEDVSENWVQNITSTLKDNDIKLFVISFYGSFKNMLYLDRIAASTGGRLFLINEELKSQNNFYPLTLLYEAFRSIYESFSWSHTNHVLIHQAVFQSSLTENEMSFIVDDTIKNLQVIITGPNFMAKPPIIRDKTVLKYEGFEYSTRHPAFSYKIKIPAYVFSIENPQTGHWKLAFFRKSGNLSPIIVIVRSGHKEHNEITYCRSWISNPSETRNSKNNPFSVYAEIHRQHKPVINASVMAHILHLESGEETVLELRDSGEGNPDITQNDGIYTRYFTGLSTVGYHILSTVASKSSSDMPKHFNKESVRKCCGSYITEETVALSGEFQRVTTYGNFFIPESFVDQKFPPRRITDLQVINAEILQNNVRQYILKWSAPGDILDFGCASSYEMKLFRSRHNALTKFESAQVLIFDEFLIQGPFLRPEIAGKIQTAIIHLNGLASGYYFIALRTTSTKGILSDVSNIVEVYFSGSLLPLSTAPLTSSVITVSTETTISDLMPTSFKIQEADTSLVIGISLGVLFLLFVIGIVLFVYLTKYKLKEQKLRNISLPYNPRKFIPDPESSVSRSQPSNKMNTDTSISHPVVSYNPNVKNKNNQELEYIDYRQQPLSVNGIYPDNISIVSCSDSKANILDQSSSIYDVPYFHNPYPRDVVNLPFNPKYTSSLRRLRGSCDNNSYRLQTDV